MDRKLYYILIIFFLLLAVYAWTSANVLLICFSILFLIVLVPLLLQFSKEAATRRINYFDDIDIIVSNKFTGNKGDWSISDDKIKINCLNKEVNGKFYYVSKHRKEFSTSYRGSDGIFKYYTKHEFNYQDTMGVFLIEFDSQMENKLAKDELLKKFRVDESRYRASGNKCILILESSFIFEDVQFKDGNVHFGNKLKMDKKVFAGAVIIGIVLIGACFFMFTEQYKVALPDDAVEVYEDSFYNQFSSDYVDLSSTIYDGSSYDRDAGGEAKSVEIVEFDTGFIASDLKINGSNKYSVPIEKVLVDLFKNTSKVGSSSINNNTNSNVNVEGIMVFYDENHNVAASEYVPVTMTRDNGTYDINVYRLDVNETPVYSAYTLGGTYANKFTDTGHSAELHLILKSNATESSSDYYCYDLVFPAEVHNDKYYGY